MSGDPHMHVQFYDGPGEHRIAYRLTTGRGPVLVFLPGYMSDMAGGKATALFDWAQANGRACLLMDYSGCGQSAGDFSEGTLSRWCAEVVALVDAKTQGPVVLVGSSMGGWLMLLVAQVLEARGRESRLVGMVGIAAAPDFTDWGLDERRKAQLTRGETVYEDNPYGPEPTPTHPGFFADGQSVRQLDGPITLGAPVRLIHGQCDADVPFAISLRLADALRSDDVQVTLVKDGDHRLSRPQDIALLLRVVSDLLDADPSA